MYSFFCKIYKKLNYIFGIVNFGEMSKIVIKFNWSDATAIERERRLKEKYATVKYIS